MSRVHDVIRAVSTHAARPAANTVSNGALYPCSDHNMIYRSDGTAWSNWLAMFVNHAASHASAGSDPVTLAQSQVTGLVTALGGKLAAASNLSDLVSASTARTNLGLGTAATTAASAYEVAGAAAAAQAASQPVDSDLTAIAALSTTAYGRAFLSLADAAAGRTALGLGTAATSGSGDFQPLDSDLTAIAALSTTAYGRAFLALADAAAGRTALGLGTAAVAATGDFDAAGAATAAQAAAVQRANHTGTQPSTTISDFTEAVQDAVAALLGAGSNITLNYDDAANTLTVTAAAGASYTDEQVRDVIGVALVGAGVISVAVNDALDTITISTTATANSTDAALRDRSTHTGTQTLATISDAGTAAAANTGTTSGTVPILGTGGVLAVGRLATGTPDGTKYVRDDGTLAVPPGAARLAPFSISGAVAVTTGAHRLYNDTGRTLTIAAVRASVGTAPTGSSLIVDVNKNGTTIFGTQANRPTIAAAGNTNKSTGMTVTTLADGDYVTVDVDQVGSTVAGSDLTVQIETTG